MRKNVKWDHAPPHEAASHWLPDGYSLPIGGTRAASRLPFAIGETLTLFEAARLISGRHPYPLLDDGVTTLGPDMGFISAGSTRKDRRRHRPQRGIAAYEALQLKVMNGEIIPVEMCHLAQPGTISDGGIDWLNVKVATADVVHLCKEKGWRCGLLRKPLTTSAPPKPLPDSRLPEEDERRYGELEIKPEEKFLDKHGHSARGQLLFRESDLGKPFAEGPPEKASLNPVLVRGKKPRRAQNKPDALTAALLERYPTRPAKSVDELIREMKNEVSHIGGFGKRVFETALAKAYPKP